MIVMTLSAPTIVARSSNRKMAVASCLSANGKPPSTITWDTRLKGEASNQETQNENGTVTVLSNYVLVPSRATHKQKLTCIVTYRNERITDSVILNVLCKSPVLAPPGLTKVSDISTSIISRVGYWSPQPGTATAHFLMKLYLADRTSRQILVPHLGVLHLHWLILHSVDSSQLANDTCCS